MQQTTKYQFNLIEGGDDFSPNPLNENMEKVEEALSETSSTLSVLTETVEGRNFTVGSFTGNSGTRTVDVGFTPTVVIVCGTRQNTGMALVVPGKPFIHIGSATTKQLEITENGFTIRYVEGSSFNYVSYEYCYLAMRI